MTTENDQGMVMFDPPANDGASPKYVEAMNEKTYAHQQRPFPKDDIILAMKELNIDSESFVNILIECDRDLWESYYKNPYSCYLALRSKLTGDDVNISGMSFSHTLYTLFCSQLARLPGVLDAEFIYVLLRDVAGTNLRGQLYQHDASMEPYVEEFARFCSGQINQIGYSAEDLVMHYQWLVFYTADKRIGLCSLGSSPKVVEIDFLKAQRDSLLARFNIPPFDASYYFDVVQPDATNYITHHIYAELLSSEGSAAFEKAAESNDDFFQLGSFDIHYPADLKLTHKNFALHLAIRGIAKWCDHQFSVGAVNV